MLTNLSNGFFDSLSNNVIVPIRQNLTRHCSHPNLDSGKFSRCQTIDDSTNLRQMGPLFDVIGINWAFSFVCFDARPYFRRRSNAFEGMAVASFLGVSSGVYIWKPFFEEMKMNRLERERREREEAAGSNHS